MTAGLLLAMLAGCGTGEGMVAVTAYGEAFIEEGIPAADVDDGWAIQFDRFVVTVKDIQVAGVAVPDASPVDLSVATSGAGHPLGSVSAPEGDHKNASFTITRIEIQGSGSKSGTTKTFSWTFDQPTRYTKCDTTTSVPDGGTGTFQITVHADHLFYNSLVSEEPSILFQAIADADANADGAVTQAELAATSVGAYDPGNEDIDDLWTWLVAQTRTLGHVDGEGHCDAAAIN